MEPKKNMPEHFQKLFTEQGIGSFSEGSLSVSVARPSALAEASAENKKSEPLILLISGSSESGKSHLGKYFVTAGAGNRLKFYKTLADTEEYRRYEKESPKEKRNPFDFAESIKTDKKARNSVFQAVKGKYISLMKSTGVPVAVVETIKHPWIVDEFRKAHDLRVVSIFIDAPINQRVEREAQKLGVSSNDILERTLKKDEWKDGFGNEQIRSFADITIDNAGTLDTYNDFLQTLENFVRKISRQYNGAPHDFS